ncbi:KR domain-containing protein [Aspergillus falconensis]
MAGEAIRQLTGRLDFTVRKTNIITALVMHEDRPTEVLTQFRPSRVTVTLDSDWYDFTIMSLLDGVWTKNCTGQARGGRDFCHQYTLPRPRTTDRRAAALFLGDVDSLSLLLEDDLLAAIYNFIQLCDFADFFRVFAHNRPRMRVLEIGAGTGGVTAAVLPALQGPHGERMYHSYTYTDILAMIYRPLDITIDPLAQGFDSGSYDLIIASNAVHVTASLQESLGNVRKLLKPDGKLFLQELAPITKWINYIILDQERPTEQMVISLLELHKPLVHSLGAEEFLNLRDLINSLGTTPLLWLTRPSQVACSDPRYAPILGLLRTARTELLVTAATLELDSLNERALGTAVTVAERLMKGTSLDPSLDPVLEYAYSRGQLMRGLLQTLSWKPKPASTASPPDDWVEVQTRAVGLNFKDLLIAMGVVDGGDLGAECAGVVRRVGLAVKDLRVGDRVAVFAAGSFSTRLITSGRLCARMARELGWVEAATMPCIYCTVGSDRKVKYLVDIGIPQDRIFRSRDNTFLHDVLAATGGRGVDVVLNSLSGELLHASWQCVAEFGTMVELGKRDFIGKGHLAMEAFESNRTFTGVDLGLICERRPDIIRGLLRRCMHHFALGELSPLPVQEFAAEHVEQAFRYMQKGTHVGKIAVIMPDEPSTLPLSLNPRTPQFCPDACHLIIGGLGGLGRSVSSWMSLHGARHFVFFSRSAADREQDDFVLELRAQGCRVDLVSGDVSNEEDVDGLIERLQHPLAGITQASMVLRDISLATMSYKDWQAAYVPKVQGTWNLHRSLEKSRCSVDYFVLFSSWSGLVGQSGQANYAAGNAFLDAFVQYRHSLGRPCSAINIGVVEDVGYVSRNPHLLDHFRATSVHTLQEQNLLDRVQLAIDNSLPAPDQHASAAGPLGLSSYTSHSQICIGLRTTIPLESQGNRTLWRRDPRMALYHNMGASGAKPTNTANEDDQALDHFLQQAKLTPAILSEQASADLLAEETGKALFNFMLRDHSELDYNVPLANLGVDSLLAIELRNWFRLKMTLDVTVLEILGSGSLRRLGDLAAKNMASKMDAAEASSSDKTATLRDIETRYLNMKAP